MRVVATAGHVDHGKSSLVHALTGTDPDRWEEEKRRGLTIDLGFAHANLPSGAAISFVDVPGHIRFLRNMLAGVGAVDACLFVVAATEGWKPQSEEHLRILHLLGLNHGVIALTKVDLVDEEWGEIAALDVADHVAGTFLADAPIVPVSATTGRGVDELRDALDVLVATTPAAVDRGRPRLWIDRSFAARGSGTVVTGTLTGGYLQVDQRLLAGARCREVRIRAVQSLGEAQQRIGPGNRVALNLVGVDHGDVQRGDALVVAEQWLPTARLDASLQVLDHLDHDVSRRGAHVAYIGSGEFPVRVRVLGTAPIRPGAEGAVRLHLPHALPLLPGDRYVLREWGRSETVGGGEVLDIHPVLPASKARPDRDEERLLRERGWVTAIEHSQLTGRERAPTIGRWVATSAAVTAMAHDLRARVADSRLGIDVADLDERQRCVLATMDDVVVESGFARAAERHDPLSAHPFVTALREGGFSPPDAAGADRTELRQLVRRRLVVERDGTYFHNDTVEAAIAIVRQLLAQHPAGFTLGQLRDATGSTRKHTLPLAAELDARGVTRRRDDLRIAGPRLVTG